MKFVRWNGEVAWFRPATRWERIKAWWYWRFTGEPDPKNILLDFDEADKILKEYKEDKNGRKKNKGLFGRKY